MIDLSAAIVQHPDIPAFYNNDIKLDVLRLDKIHPVISGNKWFKLKYYLQEAVARNHDHLLSFGGPFSNHIVALACAAQEAGLTSTGIIRGEKPALLSHTLKAAINYGMQLHFISRQQYNQKKEPAFIKNLGAVQSPVYIIPEGGEGLLGIQGAAEILDLVDKSYYTHIICAVGTGTMLTGLGTGSLPGQQVLGIAVLKGFEDWQVTLADNNVKERICLIHGYDFGGYAKKNTALITFMNTFYQHTGIPTDFVYTAKMFYGVSDLLVKNYFPPGSRLLCVHSGGLQGNDSLPAKTLVF